MFIRDGKDVTQANWMRHVQPAVNGDMQNLIAYQEGQEIYFLAVRQIEQNEELFVWYCYDYAKRLNYSTHTEEERPITKYTGNFPKQQAVDVSKYTLGSVESRIGKFCPRYPLLKVMNLRFFKSRYLESFMLETRKRKFPF